MSFGWSAGDLAQAIIFITKLTQSLDSVNGAAGDYRVTFNFLEGLKRTLEPLPSLLLLGLPVALKDDISCQLKCIKQPVEDFLKEVANLRQRLGDCASRRRFSNIKSKLQWHYLISDRAEKLKARISRDLHVLDALLHRAVL
jgi:hypothetical protein